MLWLNKRFSAVFAGSDPFEAVAALDGETFREVEGRRTFKFVHAGTPYFAKVHAGVGWGEIFKNLVTLRVPVLSARNEFEACAHLVNQGMRVPEVQGFGVRGVNPARQSSFVILEALEDHVSLEDVTDEWPGAPPGIALKRALIDAVGRTAAALHAAGVNHRDFYICHLLAHAQKLARGEVELAIIDLHRAQLHDETPMRWIKRDLAALLYSTMHLDLGIRDWFRFVRAYTGRRPAAAIRDRSTFWRRVVERAERLYAKDVTKGIAPGAGETHARELRGLDS